MYVYLVRRTLLQYINLVDTAIKLQTCSGRFPSLLSALSLALVIVTERLRALRLLTLEQVSPLLFSLPFLWTFLARCSNRASTAPRPYLAPKPYRSIHTLRHTLVFWYASFSFVSLCRTSRRFSPMASISTR